MTMRKHISRALKATAALVGLLVLVLAATYGLLAASRPPRTNTHADLFQGVTYTRMARTDPRPGADVRKVPDLRSIADRGSLVDDSRWMGRPGHASIMPLAARLREPNGMSRPAPRAGGT